MDGLKRMLVTMLMGVLPVSVAGQEPPASTPNSGAAASEAGAWKPDERKRQALVESLRALQREPDNVLFHSAMCYDMTMPPASVQYTCETCGAVTDLPYQGPGELSVELPYLKRSLRDLPVKVTVDASSLCSKCGGGKPCGIVLTTSCGECGKTFSWSVSTSEEKDRLKLLFIAHPVRFFDAGPKGMGMDGTDAKRVIENADYIASRLFCEDCRNKLGLTGK